MCVNWKTCNLGEKMRRSRLFFSLSLLYLFISQNTSNFFCIYFLYRSIQTFHRLSRRKCDEPCKSFEGSMLGYIDLRVLSDNGRISACTFSVRNSHGSSPLSWFCCWCKVVAWIKLYLSFSHSFETFFLCRSQKQARDPQTYIHIL